jgi:uncharacterized Zn-binding protein involved in type VI secretion
MILPSKVTDKTIGTCKVCGGTHYGEIIEGSDFYKIDSLKVARVGDQVMSDCKHLGTINKGSDYHFVEGIPAAFPGDTFVGDYTGTILG